MSIVLRQQTVSSNFGFNGFYTSDTLAGSLLVCVCGGQNRDTNSNLPFPSVNFPVTTGLLWQQAARALCPVAQESTNYFTEAAVIYYVLNAPVVSHLTATQVTATNTATTFNANGFQLLEFVLTTGAGDLDQAATSWSITTWPIGAGNFTLPDEELIIVMASDPNFNSQFTAAAGYTLTNMGGTGFHVGGCQYGTFTAGTYSTNFGNVSWSGPWACAAASFIKTTRVCGVEMPAGNPYIS